MRWMSTLVLVGCAGATSAGQDPADRRVVAPKVAQAPSLDGGAGDAAWKDARVLAFSVRKVWPEGAKGTMRAWLRSVRTDTHIYFLAEWEDATEDAASHKTWTWDAAKSAYVEGPDREDMFAMAFELSGPFDADMLSGVEATWDVWQWKASRTNPQGYAMDRLHRYTRAQPQGKAREYRARDGSKVWIARPEDAGDTVEKKQAAPKERAADKVPQYLPGTPSGSAADVRAKGRWSKGRWTLVFGRRLNTGRADDTVFDPAKTYRMAVSVHDRTGDMDQASETITLSFE